MRTLLTAAAVVAAVLFLPSAAAAMCAERTALAALLIREWEETPSFRGLTADGRVLEIFLAPSGSWSAVATLPGGAACLVAAGEAGAVIDPPAPPQTPGAPS